MAKKIVDTIKEIISPADASVETTTTETASTETASTEPTSPEQHPGTVGHHSRDLTETK